MHDPLPNSFFSDNADALENVLEHSPFGFSLISGNYEVIFANEVYLGLVEKSKEEVFGQSLFSIFPEPLNNLKIKLEEVKKSGEPYYAPEYQIRALRNGIMQDLFYNFIYHPIYEDGGSFQYFASVLMEITDVVGIKNKIKEDEERLRLATESSQTGTWDLNFITGEIIHSPYLLEMFGYDQDTVVTHAAFRDHLIPEDRVKIVEKAFEKALETGIYRYEARIIDKNGTLKWISTHGRIFYDSVGKPTRMVGVIKDISERKNSEILLKQSHHQLNMALEATRLGRFDMNPQTMEKYNFSPRFLEIFGYTDPQTTLTSTLLESHIDPKFQAVRQEALEKARSTGDFHYQTKINLADGTTKWVEFYGRLLPEQNGMTPYIAGTVRDITENKSFEKNISDSEKKYRFLADSMPQIVWIGESDGRLTYFNQATMDFSGQDYNTFLDSNGWLDIVHPDEKIENERLWKECIKNKKQFTFEHRFRNKNNEYRWFLSRARPQLDEFGNVKKWVGTSTDIDDMKRHDEHKNDFIKIAHHELKTPVTTIKGYVQLLKKMRGQSEDKFLVNSLSTIENQVNKLNLLIGDLLDISRIESGKLPLHKSGFSLVKLVTETIEDIKASDESHQINFELRHNSDVEVFADKERINQVLNNLLTNAIKYSPRAKNVEVELYVEEECAVVSVTDFGIGISGEELDKIFEPFYRVSGKDEVTFPGFGIGLFIVKDIMDRHQGKIWVTSEKNVGSKFFVALPLLKNK